MKFSISLEQRHFLNQKGYIPFYELLKEQELKTLKSSLQGPKHDNWRNNDAVKQIVFSRRLVNLVNELTNKKPIRIAFDHYLPKIVRGRLDAEKASSVQEYFGNLISMQERSSINPLVGIFLLSMNGDGYFILPGTVFPVEELSLDESYFLIAYGDSHSQYLHEERDPEVHYLKTLGYVFGDRLNDNLHPILFR